MSAYCNLDLSFFSQENSVVFQRPVSCSQAIKTYRPTPFTTPNLGCPQDPAFGFHDGNYQGYDPCFCEDLTAICHETWRIARSTGVYLVPILNDLVIRLAGYLARKPASDGFKLPKSLVIAIFHLAGPRAARINASSISIPSILSLRFDSPPRTLTPLTYAKTWPAENHANLRVTTEKGWVYYRLVAVNAGDSHYELMFGPDNHASLTPGSVAFSLIGQIFHLAHDLKNPTVSGPSLALVEANPTFLSAPVSGQLAEFRVCTMGSPTLLPKDRFYIVRPAASPSGALIIQHFRFQNRSHFDKKHQFAMGGSYLPLVFFGPPAQEEPYKCFRAFECKAEHQHSNISLARWMLRSNKVLSSADPSCLTTGAWSRRILPAEPGFGHLFQDEISYSVTSRGEFPPNTEIYHHDPFALPHPWTPDFYVPSNPSFYSPQIWERLADYIGTPLSHTLRLSDSPLELVVDYYGSAFSRMIRHTQSRRTRVLLTGYHLVRCPCCDEEAPVPKTLTQEVCDALYDSGEDTHAIGPLINKALGASLEYHLVPLDNPEAFVMG